MNSMIGETLNQRYRLEEELGRGGSGVVYRARDLLLQRDVAVKVLHAAEEDAAGQERLLREARSAARLQHPNIVTLYDVCETPELSFIVMEYVEGSALHACGSRDIGDMLPLLEQVCSALQHAHEHGVIHRDLKPDNILITRDGQARLMDFGLARTGDAPHLTAEGTLMGTFAYLAPELIQGQPASVRSDLYALGVILYECVTGRPPFSGTTALETLSQHLNATAVPPSHYLPAIPPALEALIMRLLAKHPEDRPASAAEVLRILQQTRLPAEAGAKPAVSAATLDLLVRGRIVGRSTELTRAETVWRQALAGEGSHVLLVSGEPGIGKTRLVRELADLVHLQGAHTLSGECYAEGSAPYAPLEQVILQAYEKRYPAQGEPSAEQAADLITLAPAVKARFPRIQPNPPSEPRSEQQRLYNAAAGFLLGLAPLLLVVEDVHWADSGTLALLRHLARTANAQRAALLLVLTYRELELDQARALNEMLHDLNREHLAEHIKLGRLNMAATGELLEAIFSEHPSDEFTREIYRETEGNPFYVEEVCRALTEEGKLYRVEGHWQRAEMSEIEIPQSIRIAIESRVAKLPEPAQEALRLAAVLGREFDIAALGQMSGMDEDNLIDSLERGARAQLISEVHKPSQTGASGRSTFAFAHALIPSALCEGMSSLRRERLHRRAAETLEHLYPAERLSRELAPQLGRHYSESGDSQRAAEYWLAAGARAREVYAYAESVSYYEQALALLRGRAVNDPAQAARTAMKLGMLYHTLLDYPRARAVFQEAFSLWQQTNSLPAVALPPAPCAPRFAWGTQIETLDPAAANDSTSMRLIEQLLCGLVELSPELDVVPGLARSWDINPNGCEYRFDLRSDVCWSDGQPVTAHDFVFAWKRVLEPARQAPLAEMLLDIKGAREYHAGTAGADGLGVLATDDYTLLVELEEPVGYFLYLMAVAVAYAVPRHVIQAWGEAWWRPDHMVYNGPFVVKEWQPDVRMVFERNPSYCGRFSGNLHNVELRLIRLPRADLSDLYNADMLDLQELATPAQLERGLIEHPAEYRHSPVPSTFYLGFNTSCAPFDNVRVRQAFVHALDRAYIAKVIWRGIVSEATSGFVPPGMPGHTPGIGLAYDPELAARLLAEAGYPGGEGLPEVNMLFARSDIGVEMAKYGCDCWRRHLGIQVNWQQLDWLEYKASINAAPPQILVMGWTLDYPDPASCLVDAMQQPYCTFQDERYTQYLAQAKRIADEAERFKFYRAADRLLIEQAVICPLYYDHLHFLCKPWLQKVSYSRVQNFNWRNVIMLPH
ncbi:MAG: ABC transporter substrate-binding protein [Anaerolineae bacterium]